MQRLKSAIKQVAALTAGFALLGATVTSAVTLADYPAPFVSALGVFDDSTAVVVGEKAKPIDTLGAIDIATGLQFEAKTSVSTSGSTLSVTDGEFEDVPIGMGIANTTSFALDWSLDDDELPWLTDGKINFRGAAYDTHEEVVFSSATTPSIQTSLTSSDDDYEDGVFMEVGKNSINYYYAFDDAITPSNATTTDKLEVKFLGKTLKITQVQSSNKFTAFVGTEYFMEVGDTVTVQAKKVTLQNVGSGGAIVVDVDGSVQTIPSTTTRTINGIEISNQETFYADNKEERSATLVVGENSEETYISGDEYIGEDSVNPDWVWYFDGLKPSADTATVLGGQGVAPTGPFLGVRNDFVKDDDTDNPAGVGDCIDLPNNYASVCLDSLTVADDQYLPVTVEFSSGEDTSKARLNSTGSSTGVIHIKAPGKDRFVVNSNSMDCENGTANDNDFKTSEIWIAAAENGGEFIADTFQCNLAVFAKDESANPDMKYMGALNMSTDVGSYNLGHGTDVENPFEVNFEDTKDSNVQFSIANASSLIVNIIFDVQGDSTTELPNAQDDIIINFTKVLNDGNFTSLGDTVSTEESDELAWAQGGADGTSAITALGSKDENHRTRYGLIVRDPKSNGASDQVILDIPADMVQANVVVKGPATTVAGGGGVTYIPAEITVDTRLDSQVSNPEAHQLILVGGPVVNTLTAKFMGRDWSLASGEALLRLYSNGDKMALVVAGTDGADTQMAARVLKNFKDYELKDTEVVLAGTLSAPRVVKSGSLA